MKILALDLGTKTLGLAISDSLGMMAHPYQTIRYNDLNQLLDELTVIIEKEKIKELVLGLPKNMDNSLGFASERSLEFEKELKKRYNMPVILIDERLSTKEAENILIKNNLRRNKRKLKIDSMAATIILENYLSRRK